MKKSFLLILMFNLKFFGLAQNFTSTSYINLNELPKNAIVWKSPDYPWRVWDSRKYLFVDPNGRILHDLVDYKYVGDYYQEYSVVETKTGLFGIIDISGDLVIDTIWTKARNIMSGYFCVARKTNRMIFEDRGEGGFKNYSLDYWYFISENGKLIDYPFHAITQLNDRAICSLGYDKTLSIDLKRVNFGYYHPFMKAINKINGREIEMVLNLDKEVIDYFDKQSHELLLSIPFSKS